MTLAIQSARERIASHLRSGLRQALLLLLPLFAMLAAAAGPLAAFPPAEPGMVRHVIELPPADDESALKVELQLGKTIRTDAANRYFFAGRLESESLPGWGYERHILRQLGPLAGTLMAPDPAAPSVDRFVTLAGEVKLLRYNSRLPLVVYVPEGVEVRYRLWRAGTFQQQGDAPTVDGKRTTNSKP